MRILVTGGCGFIGSHVVDVLCAHGHSVLVVDDFSTGVQENVSDGVKVEALDIRSSFLLEHLFDEFRPQVVMHLAAQASITRSYENPVDDLEVNTVGTIHLIRCCQKFGVDTFVFASTSAVYAESKKALKETSPIADPGVPYGISKYAAEQYIRALLPKAVILRLGNVYGPRQVPVGENQVIARMIQHLKYNIPFHIFGDGRQERDFVYVEDVARAFYAGMNGKPGVYNIAWSRATSVNECAETLGDLWGFPAYEWKHDWTRPEERTLVWLDTTLAAQELFWEPKTRLLDGLQKTIDWWNERD